MGQIKTNYSPSAGTGELERGILFVQKIVRPKSATPADYERWLDDPLKLPPWRVLQCSYHDCSAATAYTGYEWYLKSYTSLWRGNTIDFQKTRVLHDGWIYLRAWEQFYAFCPDHQSVWSELSLNDALRWILRLDAAGWFSSRARDYAIRKALVMYARKRDVVERRSTVT